MSKKTDYVLVGAEPGSKFATAKQLGVKIIDEAEFRRNRITADYADSTNIEKGLAKFL